MPDIDWAKFRDAVESKPLNPFHQILEPFLSSQGRALDLGCGTGRSALWLVSHGYTVDAIDRDPESLQIARQRIGDIPTIRLVESNFADFELSSYDLALSLFSVFFQPQKDFDALWPRLVEAISPGGLFAGQLIGPDDDWADESTSSFQRPALDRLFERFSYEHIEEVRRSGKTIWGEPKKWHLYHVIARKTD